MNTQRAVVTALGLCLLGWMSAAGSWSSYQVGAGIGVLSWLMFYFADKPIGASSFYANLAGLLGRRLLPGNTARLKYFQEHPPKLVNFSMVFMLATVGGAYLSALAAGETDGRWLSPMWVARFGEDSLLLRFGLALTGGILMAFGARVAGGCTSGHGISGTLQLAVSSWLFFLALFAGGVLTAKALFGGWL